MAFGTLSKAFYCTFLNSICMIVFYIVFLVFDLEFFDCIVLRSKFSIAELYSVVSRQARRTMSTRKVLCNQVIIVLLFSCIIHIFMFLSTILNMFRGSHFAVFYAIIAVFCSELRESSIKQKMLSSAFSR